MQNKLNISWSHFFIVGILFGFLLPILGPVLNYISETSEKISVLVSSLTSFVFIAIWLLIGNFIFKKVKKDYKFSMPKTTFVFLIFVSVYFVFINILPALNDLMSCLSSACQSANPRVKLIPFYLTMDIIRIIVITSLYFYIGRLFFKKEKVI